MISLQGRKMLREISFKYYLLLFIFFYQAIQSSDPQEGEMLSSSHKLSQLIIEVTEAKKDKRLDTIYRIEKILPQNLSESSGLYGIWKDLKNNYLKEPEVLLDKKAYDIDPLLPTNARIFKNHAFDLIKHTLRNIENFINYLFEIDKDTQEQYSFVNKDFINLVKNLRTYYQKFIEKLSTFKGSDLKLKEKIKDKAVLIGDLGEDCYFYRIPHHVAQYLIGKNHVGDDIPKPEHQGTTSRHYVSRLPNRSELEPKVYFKIDNVQSHLNPSRDYMLTSLYHLLKIPVPFSNILIIDDVKFGKTYNRNPFFIQASQAIEGLAGTLFLKTEHSLSLDLRSFSLQVIGTLCS